MIRILFLDLHSSTRKSHTLTKDELEEFYEKGLRPALAEQLADRGSQLPMKYRAEMFRARNRNGTFSFGTEVVPAWKVRDFGTAIRENLRREGVEWGEHIVFLHQIRGVKNSSFHALEGAAALVAFDDFLESNNLEERDLQQGVWYVDVGLEIASVDRDCLAWRTDRHNRVVREATMVSLPRADTLTELSNWRYARDLASHMTGVSGCRINMPADRGRYKACYLQMYMTDKAATSHREGTSYGKSISVQDIMNGKSPAYFDELHHLYCTAAQGVYSCARVEVRVPVQYATMALLEFDIDAVRNSLVAFPREEWWCVFVYPFPSALSD